MNKILHKEHFSEKVFKLVVEAPLIARSRKAGHFVIVRVGEKGERMPLTIAEADPVAGTITLVVQEVGLSSTRLCELNEGDYITDVVGPLGQATHIENFGTVVCAGGGVGVAPMLPIVQALKTAGNRVITVLAGRTKELIILEKEMRASSDEVIIMTDDGSYGQKGLVTQGVEQVILREKVDKCFAIGPAIMMKFVCLLTKKYDIPTDVSLNTIMVDGTGMCGACRITVGGKTKFVCVDGPEFDGHQVDFDEMLKRMGAFKPYEQEEMHKLDHPDTCQATGEAVQPAEEDKTRNAPWRVELRKVMKPKERTAIPRVKMPELDPEYRSHSRREEVNLGLNEEQALTEAKRCLDCANPGCMTGCPVGIDIPRFIKHIEKGEFLEAAKTLKETSALPAVCGRVCPQEKQCESQCIHLKMNEPAVAIGYLERFAADYERDSGQISVPEIKEKNGIKVAVVGSGPAGLSFAGDMAKKGYDVTVFEALHEIGGVLKYGIPEFRLPNKIVDVEIDNLAKMGVQFEKDCIIGKDGRTVRERLHHRQNAEHRRIERRRLQGRIRGQRCRPAQLHEHPRREQHQHPLVQRIPDARQPDGRRQRGLGHSRALRQARSSYRRRQHGYGLCPHRQASGCRACHHRLPPQRGRDARKNRGGEARQGRGRGVPHPAQPH